MRWRLVARQCSLSLVVIIVVIVGVACGSSPPPPPPVTEASSLSGVGDNNIPITNHAHGGQVEGAVLVETKTHAIHIDGQKVADATATATAKKPMRIDELFRALQSRASGSTDAGGAAKGRVAAFKFDRDEPALVVKSVLLTAGSAGYPNAAFVVRRPSGKDGGGYVPGYLSADVRSTPPPPPAPSQERELHANLSARGVVLLKWMDHGKQMGEVIPGEAQVAKLATLIERGWNEKGLHHEPTDKRFDQAIVHVDDDTPYTLLVVTLDAFHATKRKVAAGGGGGAEELVQAINVTLAAD